MKNYLMFLTTGIIFLGLTAFARAQCPEDPNDSGVCDTLYAVCQDSLKVGSPPWEVHVSLLVTNDLADPLIDSIAGLVIPLRFTHSNPAAYCTLSALKNNINLDDTANCIFRHFGGMQNRMMDLYEQGSGAEWNTLMVYWENHPEYGPPFLIMSLFPTGAEDQRWWEGSRTLLATFTFLVGDTTTIRLDTTFLVGIRLAFTRSDATSYIPRDNMPYYTSIRGSEHGDANGDGQTNVSDALYMLNYLFRHGPPPVSFEAGDANCDNDHGAMDVIFLLNYLFRGGPPPGCP